MSIATPPPNTLDLAEGPGEREPARGRRRAAPWVAAGVAVGVTALIAGGLAVTGRGPLAGIAGSDPKILNIGKGFAAGGAGGTVVEKDGLRAGRYVLTGVLPSSPTSGTAWRLTSGSINASQVTSLASALGLTGQPQRDGSDWVVRDGPAILRIYSAPGLPFSFDADPDDSSCPSIPTDGYGGPDTAVGCVMTDLPSTTPAPPGPDEATLRDLGRSLAAALDADAAVSVWTGTPYGGVMLEPSVDGVQTTGVGTSLQVSTGGVLAGSGWLGPLVVSGLDRGDTYPLRSAIDVFGDLAAMPQPAMACPETLDETAGLNAMMCGGDVTVTGANYGLTLAFDDGSPVLVPAWLFTVQDSDFPLTQVAVATKYLDEPTAPDSGGGTGGSGGSGGSTPGSVGSTGTGTEPAPPAE